RAGGMVAALAYIPLALRLAPNGHITLAVTIVIARHRHIARPRCAPGRDLICVVRTAPDIPIALCAAPERDVRFAVAIVITRHRHIRPQAPGLRKQAAIRRAFDVPGARAAAEDREISFAIAVVIAHYWHVVVGRGTQAPRHGLRRPVTAAQD